MSEQCLSDEDLAAFVDGNVWPDERPRIEGHLSRCAQCREIMVFVARSKEVIPEPVLPARSDE